MLATASSANNVPSWTADDDAVVPFDAALALADKKTTTRRCHLTQPPSTPSTRRLLMAWPRAHRVVARTLRFWYPVGLRPRLRRKLTLLGDVGPQGCKLAARKALATAWREHCCAVRANKRSWSLCVGSFELPVHLRACSPRIWTNVMRCGRARPCGANRPQ